MAFIIKSQIKLLSGLISDLGKIIFASIVIGFFVPGIAGEITLPVFVFGVFASIVCFATAFMLLKWRSKL